MHPALSMHLHALAKIRICAGMLAFDATKSVPALWKVFLHRLCTVVRARERMHFRTFTLAEMYFPVQNRHTKPTPLPRASRAKAFIPAPSALACHHPHGFTTVRQGKNVRVRDLGSPKKSKISGSYPATTKQKNIAKHPQFSAPPKSKDIENMEFHCFFGRWDN